MKSWIENIALDPAKYYELTVTEPNAGTGAQNKTFHGLLTEFVPYMSYDSWDDARAAMLFKYATPTEGCINGINFIVCASWSNCTKQDRADVINGLISEMLEAGVNGKIFDHLVAEWKASVVNR